MHSPFQRRAAGALAAVLFCPMAATAQTTSTKDQRLEQVLVSGSKEQTQIEFIPASAHRIDAETLERDRPNFIGEVANRVPGVYINNLGAEQHMASVRQPISTQGVYLYLEDGVPIRPAGLFNHNQIYEVNLAGIGNVEVIKGPMSSIFGSYATGGLMNFLNKAPSKDPSGSVGILYGDNGYRRADIDASGTFGAHGLRFSGYLFDKNDRNFGHNDSDKQAYTVRHDWSVSSRAKLTTTLTQTQLFAEQGGTLSEADFKAARLNQTPQTFTFREVDALRLTSSLQAELNPGGLTTLTAFARENTTNQVPTFFQVLATARPGAQGSTVPLSNVCTNDPSGAPPLPGVPATALQNQAGLRCGRTTDVAFDSQGVELRHRQNIGTGGSRLIGGLVYDQGGVKSLEERYTFDYNPNGSYTNKSANIDAYRNYTVDFQNQAAYLQAEWQVTAELLALIGNRYDRVTYDYSRLGLFGAPSSKDDFQAHSPKAGLVWNPQDGLSLYSNLSFGYSPPEISGKYGGANIGLLEDTRSRSIEIGGRAEVPMLAGGVDFALYNLRLSDAVYSSESSASYNADSRHRGLEVGVDSQLTRSTRARLAFSRSRQTFESEASNFAGPAAGAPGSSVTAGIDGRTLRYAPETIASLSVAHRLLPSTTVVGDMQYLSSYFIDESNTRTYGGHTLFHARLVHDLGPWEFSLAVRNLFDRNHAEFASFGFGRASFNAGEPRTVLLGARYHFGGKR